MNPGNPCIFGSKGCHIKKHVGMGLCTLVSAGYSSTIKVQHADVPVCLQWISKLHW